MNCEIVLPFFRFIPQGLTEGDMVLQLVELINASSATGPLIVISKKLHRKMNQVQSGCDLIRFVDVVDYKSER
jgi:hypothetical protein